MSSAQLFALVAGPLFALFLATAAWSTPYHIDAFSNVLPAWRLGTSGTIYLPDHAVLAHPDYVENVAWIVATEDSAVSKYPPGAALHAAPFYAIWPRDAEMMTIEGFNNPDALPVNVVVPPFGPAAIASALAVAMAIGFLAVSFRRLATGSTALAGAYVAGLGTAAWSVAANALWQHGPGMMWVALGGTLAAGRLIGSGLAYGAAILVRPLNAFIAAPTGLYIAWQERSWRPAVQVGAGALLGLAGLVVFNTAVFGEPSVLGGYDQGFVDNAQSLNLPGYVRNVALALVSPTRGLLVWSPFLIVLIPGLRAAWRAAPGWVRGGALGGLVYLLVQLKANRFSGGSGFPTYRYPLEAITAAAPLLFLSFTTWIAARPTAIRIFWVLVIVSVTAHAAFALIY